jgi:Protein of unknown function (DUF2924)
MGFDFNGAIIWAGPLPPICGMRKTLRSCAMETPRRPLPETAAGAGRAEVPPTATGLDAELAELERLSLDDLRFRWRNHWGRLAPARLSRGLLLRVMAYRLQAEAFGDLDRRIVRLLERMANGAAEKLAANGSATLGSDEHADLDRKTVRMLERIANGAVERLADDGSAPRGFDEHAESKVS